MPVDFSIPLQVQTPQPFATLNNVLGTAQGIQSLQQQNIALQVQRQANQERQNFISLIQNDPTMKPGPDGTFDLGPVNSAKIMTAMPQTGADQISKLADTNQRMTNARQAVFNLGADNQKAFGQAVNALADQPPSKRVDLLDDLQQQFPGTKPFVDMYKSGLNRIAGAPLTDQARDQALQTMDQFWSRWHMDVQQQQAAGTPTFVNKGGQLVSTKPGVANAPVGSTLDLTLPPGERTSVAINPVTGQPYAVTKPESGVGATVSGVGTTGSPAPAATAPHGAGALPVPMFPTPQQAQTATDAQGRWGAAQARDVDQNSGYNPTAQVYKNLKTLFDQNPNLGPGSSAANQFIGRISTLTRQKIPDLNTAYQEAASYLDRLSMQTGAATGAANKFQDEQAARAVGSPEQMGPPALQEKLRFGASVNEAAHAYTQATQAFVQHNKAGAYYNATPFESAWSANADPIAFRLMADKKNGDTADYKATLARATPETVKAYENLQTLMSGRIPPPTQ